MAKPKPLHKLETVPPPEEVPLQNLDVGVLAGIGVAQFKSSTMRGWGAYTVHQDGKVEMLTQEKNGELEDKFRALARARAAFISQFARPVPRKINYDR